MNNPSCACLNIKYQTHEVKDGQVYGRWACLLCNNDFIPASVHQSHLAEVQADLDGLRSVHLKNQAPELAWEIGNMRGALMEANALAEGRLKVLNEKADEARREWQRAEKAEAECDAAKKDAEAALGLGAISWDVFAEVRDDRDREKARREKAEADLQEARLRLAEVWSGCADDSCGGCVLCVNRAKQRALKVEAALAELIRVVSNQLGRGEETTPGEFEIAWRAACAVLEKTKMALENDLPMDSGVHCVHGVVSCDPCLEKHSRTTRALQARVEKAEADLQLYRAATKREENS